MCNLYSHTAPVEAVRRLFGVKPERDRLGNAAPLPAIFPRYQGPVIRGGDEGEREAIAMHWGFLMPQVSKKTGKPILPRAVNNTRDDKARTSPFWRQSFDERRCLIPATSYCEAKGRAPATYYWFGIEGDEERPLFAFAGIWRRFRGVYRNELVELDTYSMLTTTPNDLVRSIHPDRMPVILDPGDHDAWMNGSRDEAFALVRPFPADRMRIVKSGLDEKADEAAGGRN